MFAIIPRNKLQMYFVIFSRPIAIHENEHQPLKELREDVKLPETITPPKKYVSVTMKQTPYASKVRADDVDLLFEIVNFNLHE